MNAPMEYHILPGTLAQGNVIVSHHCYVFSSSEFYSNILDVDVLVLLATL